MSLQDFDRRWIFLAMGVIVVGLYAFGPAAEMKVNQYAQSYFDTIEALQPGDVVLLSADFDPASAAELEPMYIATIHHLMARDVRIVNVATWPAAPPFTRTQFSVIPPQYGKVYGKDWVELGFKPGDDVAMGNIGQSLRSTFPADARGNPIDTLDLMNEIGDAMRGIKLLVTLSAGYPGILEWIAQVGGRYQMPIVTGTTAVQTPDLFAFYPNQLKGFLGAATGATQYLQLVDAKLATSLGGESALTPPKVENQKRMLVQFWGHMLIIALIVIGNVIYFFGSRQGARA